HFARGEVVTLCPLPFLVDGGSGPQISLDLVDAPPDGTRPVEHPSHGLGGGPKSPIIVVDLGEDAAEVEDHRSGCGHGAWSRGSQLHRWSPRLNLAARMHIGNSLMHRCA